MKQPQLIEHLLYYKYVKFEKVVKGCFCVEDDSMRVVSMLFYCITRRANPGDNMAPWEPRDRAWPIMTLQNARREEQSLTRLTLYTALKSTSIPREEYELETLREWYTGFQIGR